ncbi:MAG: imelysin family protein [Planctomycetota bacterium]
MTFPVARIALCSLLTTFVVAQSASATAAAPTRRAPQRHEVVAAHAAWCAANYAQLHRAARELQRAVQTLVAAPDEPKLTAARAAWIAARRHYGRTECLRFHDGPIEPLEPLLNAWPVDEAWIDHIVADAETFPLLDATVLQLANERGGEANISTGWHAIEYLLWGKDLRADGPGERPASDFTAAAPHGERRARYLRAVTELLVEHCAALEQAWAPDADNYRRRFVAEVDASLRRMLVGATVLSAFELGGERLVVAYETHDQEQEHSCFSDTTLQDFEANQSGLVELLRGAPGAEHTSLLGLVHALDPALARLLGARLDDTLRCLRAIPAPFDQALLAADGSPAHRAIGAAVAALEEQTDALLLVGQRLGFELPLQPGG